MVIKGGSDPEIMEAEACREGVSLARDLHLTKAKMASDCQNVIRRIIGGDKLGTYGQLVREIKETIGEFQTFEFGHEGRTTNVDAHNLARSSISLDIGRHVWFLDPPVGVCKQQGQEVSDALFSLPGYLRGAEGF